MISISGKELLRFCVRQCASYWGAAMKFPVLALEDEASGRAVRALHEIAPCTAFCAIRRGMVGDPGSIVVLRREGLLDTREARGLYISEGTVISSVPGAKILA